MRVMVTIDLPGEDDTPPTRLRYHDNHVAYSIGDRQTVLVAGDTVEQVAVWFERLAADVRSKSFDADVAAATLSAAERERWPSAAEVAGEVYAPSCGLGGCTPDEPCAACQSLAGAQGGERP